MTIEWNTAWNLGSVSSETVNSDYSFADHWGHLRSRWFGLFLGAAVGMVRFPDFTPGCMPPGKETLFPHANAGGVGLYTMEDFPSTVG